MMDDDFIESVITTKNKTTHTEKQKMISREFYGMEAVAQFDEDADYPSPEGDD